MNPQSPGWIVVGAVVAAAAVLALLRRSRQGGRAYWWLAVAAGTWGAAFVAQLAAVGSVTPTAIQLSLTDLLAIAGLAPFTAGMSLLARPGRSPGSIARLADGCLMSLGIFGIAWIACLRPAYRAVGVGPDGIGAGSFAVDLVHPLADLLVLAVTLAMVLRAGRAALLPYLALAAFTLGDLIAVQDRAAAVHAGGWPQLAWLAALCLLGAAGLVPPADDLGGDAAPDAVAAEQADTVFQVQASTGRRAYKGVGSLSTAIGLTAAAIAAVVTLIFAVVTWGQSGPGPLIVCCGLTLALVVRGIGLLHSATSLSGLAAVSGSTFRQLADRTSDVVLLCDVGGLVTYASQAVSRYGYAADEVTGRRLTDLVHPDDQPEAKRAAAAAAGGPGAGGPGAGGEPRRATSLACRVRSADGTWRYVHATLSLYADPGGSEAMLVTASDVSDEVALRRQVTHLTFHDGLTGLPNRAYLEERTKDLLTRPRTDQPGSLEQAGAIFVDLDGFTAINDSVGHGAGDLLLAQAGRRLRALVQIHDTVARWGGDEFAILVEQASTQEIVDIADRLADSIAAAPFQVADREVTITASVGVAFAGSDAAEHLLRNADLAMARAKEAGGGRVEVFAAHMHADVIRRLELATDLRQAIADGGLALEYQPLVELATSRVAGVEALVRWTRRGEEIAPAEFLGIAEDSGLIVTLGEWVLREACARVAQWRESGWPVGLSVNVSFRQVSAARFAESVVAALEDAGLPSSALTLEVTERVLIETAAPMIEELSRLRQLGVRLAIDDFGTGYASLAYLRELPVDIIKIDPSFVAGLGTDGTLSMLTRTIVQVGHDLGIEIVAEGIERPEQLELLRAMGCGLGQGFLVARPMTVQGIETLTLSDGRRSVTTSAGPPGLTPVPPPFDGDERLNGSDSDAAATAPAG
jgi:diguanylate cyclase (GGDEF)-like protein/PAS domain S-box-containing protein